MQNDSKLLDDFTRMINGAAGLAMDVKREIEAQVHAQAEKFLSRMNLVSREEFDVVKAMAQKAREENEALKKRMDDLQKSK